MPEDYSAQIPLNPYGNPQRVLDYIARQITDLIAAESGERSAEVFRLYERGKTVSEIAKSHYISPEQVRQILNAVYVWLAHRFSGSRLRMLLEMPDPPISKEALEELYAKLDSIWQDRDAVVTASNEAVPQGSFQTDLTSLNLSTRSLNVLYSLRVTTIEELCQLNANQILMERNSGNKTLKNIQGALAKIGLSLKR